MGHFKEALVRANLGECAEAILTVVDSFQDIRDMYAGDMEDVEKKLTSNVKKRKFRAFVAAVQSGEVAEGRASGTVDDHVRLVRPQVAEHEGVVAGAVDDDPSLTALIAAAPDESEERDDRQVPRDWPKAAKQWRETLGARHPCVSF